MLRAIGPALAGPVLACLAFASIAGASAQERIVAIGGSVTEIVYALGAGERLVAVDSTSLYPEAATALPDVGYMRRLSAEPILALAPDRVLAIADAGPPAVLDQLREAGVAVGRIADEPSPAGVAAKIRAIAAALDLAAAGEALADRVTAEFAALAAEITPDPDAPRVLFVMHAGRGAPMVGGTGTAADAIIRLAGAANAAAALAGYKPLSPEAAIAAAPEVILTMSMMGAEESLLGLPDFAQTPAGRARALVAMDGNLLLGFGPRTPAAARELAAALARFAQGATN